MAFPVDMNMNMNTPVDHPGHIADLRSRVARLESFVGEHLLLQSQTHAVLSGIFAPNNTPGVPVAPSPAPPSDGTLVEPSPAPPSTGPRRILPIPADDDTPKDNDPEEPDDTPKDAEDDRDSDDTPKDSDEDRDSDADPDEDAEDPEDDDEPPAKRPKTAVKRVVMTSYAVSNGRGAPQFVIRYKYGARQYETGMRALEHWLTKEKNFGSFPAAIKAGFIIFADTFKKVTTSKKVSERQTTIMKELLKAAKKAA